MRKLTEEEREISRQRKREYNREYLKKWRQTERGAEIMRKSHKKYQNSAKGKEAIHRSYMKHRDERLEKMRQYSIKKGRADDYFCMLMDTQDNALLLMFEDILERREIAEMEIKIKFRDIGGVQ